MKPFCFLLTLLLICTHAAANEPFQFLRSGGFDCAEQHSSALQRIIDARDPDDTEAAIKGAVLRGSCGPRRVAIAVAQVRMLKTGAGNSYVCFHEIDPADGDDLGSYCTSSQFVTTIESEIGRRKGDYTIRMEDASAIRANCTEGGAVIIYKRPNHWERASAVFPKRLEPATRPVADDRETVLRAGCRGVDYQD